jgi:hypothetical protein
MGKLEQSPLSQKRTKDPCRDTRVCMVCSLPAPLRLESPRSLSSSSHSYQSRELRNDLQARGYRRSVSICLKIYAGFHETDVQPGLHPPGPNQAVYREDCTQCFDSIVSPRHDVIFPTKLAETRILGRSNRPRCLS